jgi:hypothetical protein
MKVFSSNDIINLITIYNNYKNINSSSIDSIDNMTSNFGKLFPNNNILSLFLFLNLSIFNDKHMTDISHNIIDKMIQYSTDQNNDILIELNVLLNNYNKEYNQFISDYYNNYVKFMIQFYYELIILNKIIYNDYLLSSISNIINQLTDNIYKSLLQYINNSEIKNLLNSYILQKAINNNFSEITEIINSPLFIIIYESIKCDIPKSIRELISLTNKLYNTHLKNNILLNDIIDIDNKEYINNHTLLFVFIYKICTAYEDIIQKYINLCHKNYLYKYILDILFDPAIFQVYKKSDHDIVIFLLSILYIMYQYLFSDSDIL